MKKTLIIMAMLVIASIIGSNVLAQDAYSVYAKGGTTISTNLSTVIIGTRSRNGGQPLITYINATGDTAASVVKFYNVTQRTTANYVNATNVIPVTATNGFSSGDVIVIQHVAADTYERCLLTTMGSTNLLTTIAPTSALAVGDNIFKVTAAGTISVGSATKELNGAGIFSGTRGNPLLVEINGIGTNTINLNAVNAVFVP